MDLELAAVAGIVPVRVGRSHYRVRLTERALDVGAAERLADVDNRLLTRSQRHKGVDDAAAGGAAVRVGDPPGRHDVHVDPDRLGVIALIADLDDKVLDVGDTVAEHDTA